MSTVKRTPEDLQQVGQSILEHSESLETTLVGLRLVGAGTMKNLTEAIDTAVIQLWYSVYRIGDLNTPSYTYLYAIDPD